MKKIIRTNSDNPDFTNLIHLLDIELRHLYQGEQNFFDQFNKVAAIRHIIVAYINDEPVGCGAIKEYSKDTVEIKRMFVKNEFRRQGVAKTILQELELWAKELNFFFTILETGKSQPEAINFYQKSGYKIIPNYAQYIGVYNSLCMRKEI